MKNKIQILSPATRCHKTQKIIRVVEQIIQRQGVEAEFEIITDVDEMVKFGVIFIPAVVVNGRVVSAGYRPVEEDVIKLLHK